MKIIKLKAILIGVCLMVSVTFIDAWADINRGLVGYWKLDENTGTSAADSSGNGQTGSLNDGTTWATGKRKYAASFDGNDDDISLTVAAGAGSSLTTATITAWIYSTSLSSYDSIIESRAGGGLRGLLITSAGKLGFIWDADEYDVASGLTPSINKWYFVAVVINGNTAALYMREEGTGSFSTYSDSNSNSAQTIEGAWNIGQDPGFAPGAGRNWSGYIDEVRLYNRALSSGEITEVYNKGSLTAHWKFDDNVGLSATDSGEGVGYTGTLTNGPTWGTGKKNYGVVLDGTNDYVVTTLMPNYTEGTLTAWVYPTATHTNSYVFMSANGSANRVYMQWNGGFICTRGQPAGSVTVKAAAALNTWHHVACTWDTTNVYGYYNGAYVSSAAYTDPGGVSSAYQIGSQPGCVTPGGCNIPATLDDLRVYDRKLTTAEIRQIYQGSNTKARLDGN